MKQAARKNHRTGKRIFLGFFFTIGTVIILLAAFVVFNMFFSKNIPTAELTKNTSQFLELYEENNVEHNLPEGIEVTRSTCRFDGGTYTVSVEIQCTKRKSRPLELQLYYNQDFEESRQKLTNPFARITKDDNVYLEKGDVKEFSVTGTMGKDETAESLKEKLGSLYLEIILGNTRSRIILPVTFI